MATLPDLAGLPFPLWIARCDQGLGTLLPSGCGPMPERRTWLLFLCLEGTVPLLLRGQKQDLGEGRLLLCPLPHNGLALRPQVARWQALAYAFVGFDDLVEDLQKQRDEFGIPLDGWLVRQLTAMADQPIPLDLGGAVRLVSGILVNIIEHNLQNQDAGGQSKLLRRAVALCNRSVEQPVAIADLAAELGISRGYFARIFREGLGLSPQRYLQERRVRRACELLRSGEDDIAAIARRLTYDSTSAFAAVFRASTGMSPSEYRNSRSVPVWQDP